LWIRVADCNTAHVHASLDLEEALVAPVGAPGVLDEPVLDAVFDSEANDNDGMVDVVGGVLADS